MKDSNTGRRKLTQFVSQSTNRKIPDTKKITQKKIKEKNKKKNGSTPKHPQMVASKTSPTVVILGYLTALTSSINIKIFITMSEKTFRAPGFA